MRPNKIPQEIEEKYICHACGFETNNANELVYHLSRHSIKGIIDNYEDNHNWINEKDCFDSGFMRGFKAGQKQSEDAFKEMIEEWNIIYDNGTSFFEKKDGSFRTNSGEVFVKELLSQLNSKEKGE